MRVTRPPFLGYLDITVAGDMHGRFTNPKGITYLTSLVGCDCMGYNFTGHCKHWTWLWNQTPCACGCVAHYATQTDNYVCRLCGRTQTGDAVREARARRTRKTA